MSEEGGCNVQGKKERGGRREGSRSKGTGIGGISRKEGMVWEARRVKI